MPPTTSSPQHITPVERPIQLPRPQLGATLAEVDTLIRVTTARQTLGNPRRLMLILSVCVLLVLAAPAHAGIGDGNGEIGFDFGFTEFDSNTADDTGGRFVVRGGYHFSNLFELEGHLAASALQTVGDQDGLAAAGRHSGHQLGDFVRGS